MALHHPLGKDRPPPARGQGAGGLLTVSMARKAPRPSARLVRSLMATRVQLSAVITLA